MRKQLGIVEHVEKSAVGIDQLRSCEECGDGELLEDLFERWFPISEVSNAFSRGNWLVERWRVKWQCATSFQQLISICGVMRSGHKVREVA